jgi:hypothetical protein
MPKTLEEDISKTIKIVGIELYNIPQLSKLLKTSKYTLRKNFREGKFPPVKIAGNYYLSKSDLFEFIKQGKIERPVYNFDKNMKSREMFIKNAENSLEFFKNYLKIRRIDKAQDNEIKVLEEIYYKIKDYLKKYKNE